MNLASPWNAPSKSLFRIAMKCRRLLPKKRSQAFGPLSPKDSPRIERICVINLNRQPARWAEIEKELRHVLDWSGVELWDLAERYTAVDASHFDHKPPTGGDVDRVYTLREQLFVEPQPLTLPARLELDAPIQMSMPEIAVALSHIGVWRQVAAGSHEHVLVLEDDVWFRPGFASHLDQAWSEIQTEDNGRGGFDILYLSYQEAKGGAPKTFLSGDVFCPVRGLWHLSGYVISREGAKKFLRLLPCRGPVDLWMNHQFESLDVRATRLSIISQRRDLASTNSYSVLPALTRIGAITSEGASLFQVRPSEGPVFAFGPEGSGLSSLAMALSMLGYRCCSDLQELPYPELAMLLAGADDRVFSAYVNIGSLMGEARALSELYPGAKFIVTASKAGVIDDDHRGILDGLKGADTAVLDQESTDKWQVLCEHLRCAPPACAYPELFDLGQRQLLGGTGEGEAALRCKTPKRDMSPWVVEPRWGWRGIHSVPTARAQSLASPPIGVRDCLETLDTRRWLLRDDTFTDNLALFRPSNIDFRPGIGAALSVKREPLGVRQYSAASITSRDQFLFGRFEATIRVSNVPGVVTGFFLHRDSPRQEIDIEIMGNRTDRVSVNVFYNPGAEGAKFDYGYRGAASHIDLGFDASESEHVFAIEWEPCEIRWLVDNRLVHTRSEWDPTPIPHLPMAVHVNIWPSRSRELAGRLASRRLPTTTYLKSISLEANRCRRSPAL